MTQKKTLKPVENEEKCYMPPLFDRLVNSDALSLMDLNGLKQSIQKEISLMLNTRSGLRKLDQQPVIEVAPDQFFVYPDLIGRADFSFFDPGDTALWYQIEEHLENLLKAIEPRLKNPVVKVESFDATNGCLNVVMKGGLMTGNSIEIFTFPLNLETPSNLRPLHNG